MLVNVLVLIAGLGGVSAEWPRALKAHEPQPLSPTIHFTTVTTPVSVPDGGTVLRDGNGVKRTAETRREQGVPMLDRVPGTGPFLRNQGVVRASQSLATPVTPRLIITEDEEEKLGVANP